MFSVTCVRDFKINKNGKLQITKKSASAYSEVEGSIDNLIAEIENLEEENEKLKEKIEELESRLSDQK